MTRSIRVAAATVAVLAFAFSSYHLFTRFDWGALPALLLTSDPVWFFGGGAGSILAAWGAKALRWQRVLARQGAEVSFGALFMVSGAGGAAAALTPFQAGDAVKVELLRAMSGLEPAPAYGFLIAEKLFDLAAVFAIATAGVVAHLVSPALGLATLAALAVSGIAASAVAARVRFAPRLALVASIADILRDARLVAEMSALSASLWVIVGAGWWTTLRAAGVHLGLLDAFYLAGVITAVNILSFVPGAVSVSEVGIAVLLERAGHAAPLAQSGALLLRAYGLLVLALGVLVYLLWPRRPQVDRRPAV